MPWNDNGCLASRILSRCLRAATRCADIRHRAALREARKSEERTVKQIEINRLLFSPPALYRSQIWNENLWSPRARNRKIIQKEERAERKRRDCVLVRPSCFTNRGHSVRLIKMSLYNVTELRILSSNRIPSSRPSAQLKQFSSYNHFDIQLTILYYNELRYFQNRYYV